MNSIPDFIAVGRFGRPRGVSGEIFINELTDNPERFRQPGVFWVKKETDWQEIRISQVKFVSGRPAVMVEGVISLVQARMLTNTFIYIRKEELTGAPEGSFYHFELIGCRVIDKQGNSLGQVIEIESYPASDVWIIERNGQRFMFPAVGKFVNNVNIAEKLIKIDPPEGIFDIPDEN